MFNQEYFEITNELQNCQKSLIKINLVYHDEK